MISFLKSYKNTLIWFVLAGVLGGYLSYIFFYSEDKTAILPGTTTNGHHQIEQQCDVCHTNEKKKNVFTSSGVPNSACTNCHGEDLENFSDSHPTRKFKNPENAIFTQHIDALSCVECHSEHNAKITENMGVTIPEDFCAHCHEVTLENLESHQTLAFNTCDASGCHNYHDNVALAPGFLLKQFNVADHKEVKIRPTGDLLDRMAEEGIRLKDPLTASQANAPADKLEDGTHLDDWDHSAHARAGVNCMDCHTDRRNAPGVAWIENPTHKTCAKCHDVETEDFYKGKHGMRLKEDLSPMTPAMARIAMHTDAAHQELDCNSCHTSHRYDREFASYQACIQCHDDEHTQNYEKSKHFKAWKSEIKHASPTGSGVSCATCHMPTVERGGSLVVNHNQSENLTPNEKMLKNTCLHCHGAEFAMSALADENLIQKNFFGEPERRHPGVSWAVEAAVKRGHEAEEEMKAYLEAFKDNEVIEYNQR